MPAQPKNLFVNRESGAICQVVSVDESHAKLHILAPTPAEYAMPIKEYDANFGTYWRPARPEDLAPMDPAEGYRPPASVPDDWS